MKIQKQTIGMRDRWKQPVACVLSGILAAILVLGAMETLSCRTAEAGRLGTVGPEDIVKAQAITTAELQKTNAKLDLLISLFRDGKAKVMIDGKASPGKTGLTGGR